MAKTVQEVKKEERIMMPAVETYMKIGESEYICYVNMDQNGNLVIVPETPTEGCKRTVVYDVRKLFDAVREFEEFQVYKRRACEVKCAD